VRVGRRQQRQLRGAQQVRGLEPAPRAGRQGPRRAGPNSRRPPGSRAARACSAT
jgi:hypothetical protein